MSKTGLPNTHSVLFAVSNPIVCGMMRCDKAILCDSSGGVVVFGIEVGVGVMVSIVLIDWVVLLHMRSGH